MKHKSKDKTTNVVLKMLLWVGIAAITMFFGGLTSAYIVRKAEGNWTDIQMPDWFLFSTITIVCSSVLLIFAKHLVKQNKNATLSLFLAFFLGILFSFFQFKGWGSLVEQGIDFTGEQSHVASSFLYVLTFSHLLHLVGGLIALLITAINSERGKYSADNLLGIELTSIYWHYLAVLWLYLFFFIQYV